MKAPLESVASLLSSGYWEMNEEFRFTRFEGHSAAGSAYADIVGKLPWEIEGQEIEGGWQEQEAFLREHACDESQGYHFSKPIPPDKFAELLRRHVPSGQSTASCEDHEAKVGKFAGRN